MLKAHFRRVKSLPQRQNSTGAPDWRKENPHDHYKFEQELGRGKFGVTSQVTHLATGIQYAIKVISKFQPEYNETIVQREVDLLHRLSAHPNIAGLHELYEDAGHKYIVLELCKGGELFDLIVTRGFFTEKEVAIVARTLLQVVEYCHRRNVLHRDLKPENFLLKNRTGSIEKDNLRAVDFGLSAIHHEGEVCKQVVGSAYYLAPEVLRGAYSFEADAWSIGVMLYIMLCGMPPFWGRTDGEIFQRVLNEPLDLQIDPWPEVSDSAKDLVARLLTRDVKKRITVKEALKHQWILNMADLPDKPMSSVMLTRLKQFTAMSKLKMTLLNLVAKHLNPAEIGSLRSSFLAMDEDGSGFLDVEKLQNGLSRCSVDPRATDVQRLMQQLDMQHKRDMPATLSYEDFLAAALDTQRQLSAQSLSSIFSALDQDGDGFLTAEELADGLQGCDIFANVDDIMQMMEQEADSGKVEERKQNLKDLHRISVAGFVDIIQQSTKGELQVAQLESAARQMSTFAQSNRLKQLASLIVARTSPAEEINNLRDLFEQLDGSRTGRIPIAILAAGLRDKCSLADREVKQITSALDVNQDGEVDWEEFVASAAAHQNTLSEAKLRAAFEFIDADKDGRISKEDLRHMLMELQVDVSELDTLMQLADSNGDGFVDFQEFESLMNSPVVHKPNALNRMSVQPQVKPATVPEDEEPTAEAAALSVSPVHSLMTAMESSWMAGRLTRIKTLPRSVTQAVRRRKST